MRVTGPIAFPWPGDDSMSDMLAQWAYTTGHLEESISEKAAEERADDHTRCRSSKGCVMLGPIILGGADEHIKGRNAAANDDSTRCGRCM